MPRAIIIAGLLIGAAILIRQGWAQATTTPFTTGWVVAACGTPPVPSGASGWSYLAGGQAPITMTTGGALCVNQ